MSWRQREAPAVLASGSLLSHRPWQNKETQPLHHRKTDSMMSFHTHQQHWSGVGVVEGGGGLLDIGREDEGDDDEFEVLCPLNDS